MVAMAKSTLGLADAEGGVMGFFVLRVAEEGVAGAFNAASVR
jgi:hypothetical protein